MSIAKPFTFSANTYAKASEVNANFDTVYSQVNSNISAISQNTVDIDNLENNKADINGSSTQVFAVANPESGNQAVNKQYLMSAIGNSLDYISGYTITKYSNNAIIVSAGSCYDSGKTVVLTKSASTTKTNSSQSAGVTYYVYVIGNNTGSSTDILITTSSTVPGLPSGYTKYRQIGKYTTDSSNKISTINYYGQGSTAPQGIAAIVETYHSGDSWYRVWSDGWCEQGGVAEAGSVTFLKPFANTNYTVLVNNRDEDYNANSQADKLCQPKNLTTTSFDTNGRLTMTWFACGYIS